MPRRATDRVPLAGDQRVVICRRLGAAGSCDPVGNLLLDAGSQARYLDPLPSSLATGGPQLLTYTVLLENQKRQSAGPSNPAYTIAGSAPPTVGGLSAQVGPAGIALHWQPAASTASSAYPASATGPAAAGSPLEVDYLLRLHRARKLAPGENAGPSSQESRAGVAQPLEQTLEVREAASSRPASLAAGWRLDHAVDQDAALNRTYLYTVERVARVHLGGHSIEVSGGASQPLTIEARDLFPPAVPGGLEAVADSQAGAIDLSWSPDTEPDLAGYFVYRRVAGSAGPPLRTSGAAALPNAAWRDPSVQRGVRYAYSVSAVDTSGNESERTPEVLEATQPVDGERSPAPPAAANPGRARAPGGVASPGPHPASR